MKEYVCKKCGNDEILTECFGEFHSIIKDNDIENTDNNIIIIKNDDSFRLVNIAYNYVCSSCNSNSHNIEEIAYEINESIEKLNY